MKKRRAARGKSPGGRPELPCSAPADSFSYALSMARRASGVFASEMAKLLRVAQPAINNYESGKHLTRETTVQRYAVALKMTARLVFLVKGKPPKPGRRSPLVLREAPCTATAGSWAHAISTVRRRMGVSKTEIAIRLGVSLPVISKAESGEGHLTEHTVRQYAAALGATVEIELRARA